jgi:hypothetical protein
VKPPYYSAAWTERGCLITCSHHHPNVREAVACIRTAGGYVVAVRAGVMRSLTAEEESEFQDAAHRYTRNNPPAEDSTPTSSGAAFDSRYAVMIRIRLVDRWTWRTWMCFDSNTEAAADARQGNKVVRFRSPEWVALRQRSEPASPIILTTPQGSLPARDEGETFVEFVLRFLSARGMCQQGIADVNHSSVNSDGILSVGNQENHNVSPESETFAEMVDLLAR